MIRLGSVCTGMGGLDLAAEMALGPLEHVWHAENDPDASKVLAAHQPNIPNLGDISKVDWSGIEPVDVLTAGFPCTDLSAAGRRAGLLPGNRSGVWSHVAEAIAVLRPSLVLIENVEGILSARAHSDVEPCPWCVGDRDTVPALRALGAVCGDLANVGFDAQWATVAASDVGACHRRRRVFLAAWPATNPPRFGHGNGGPPSREGLPPVPVGSNPPLMPTPRSSDRFGPGLHGDGGLDLRTAVTLLPTPTARDSTRGAGWADQEGRPLSETIMRLLPTPRATDDTNGGPNQRGVAGDLMLPSAVQPSRWGQYEAATARWGQVMGRAAPEPTETGQRGGQRLSPRFVEWMMGLPDGWVTNHVGRNAALRILGNGVVPQQAAAAYQSLLGRAHRALAPPRRIRYATGGLG